MAKTILLIDDANSIRKVIGITLTKAGYDVLEAGDGQEALALLDGRKIHLIISDVNMPVMDGIAFLKQIKQLAAYKFTPIIMLTTESSRAKKQEGQQAGAWTWVVKPFQPPILLDAIAKMIN